jgi:hypothetical protein
VTITGTGFGTTAGTVKFSGVEAKSTSWTDTKIEVTVPAGAKTGNVIITIGAAKSSPVKFTVDPTPAIKPTLSPTHGTVGTPVTITGTGFGTTAGTVKFSGVEAKSTSWTDTKIEVTVPAGAKTGNVIIKVGGVDSSPVKFTLP